MRDRIYIATFSENAAAVAGDHGFGIEVNDFCVSENLDEDKVEESLQAACGQLKRAGIAAPDFGARAIFHGPFTEIIPASIDHRIVSLGMERLQEAYRAAERMGISRMVVHTGYVPLLYFKEWHHEKSLDFWRRYMDDKPRDFRLYIENVFEDEPLMMRRLIEELDDSRIRACLDIGHANAMTCSSYTVLDWIKVLGPLIGHFHLHNNDGSSDQHADLDRGSMDMDRIFDAIEACCSPDVTMTIESRACQASAQWLERRMKRKKE